jgi:hypothetical protein
MVTFCFQRGHAPQQNCAEEEAIAFWGEMQPTIDSAGEGATKVLTMDINASICIQRPHEDVPACGPHGLERVSPAGGRLKDWLSQSGLCAISTHFCPPAGGHGFGTWKHPRSHNLCQNDHVFVSRSSLKVVKSCRNFSPLVVSDHLTVKAVFRVAAKLSQKGGDRLEAAVRGMDCDVLRPFAPSFNPVIAAQFRESFRTVFHAESDLPTCERGEHAILMARVATLNRRKKRSADWRQSRRLKLGPLRDRTHATTKSHVRQRKRKKLESKVVAAKSDAVRACNKYKSCCRDLCIQRKLGTACEAMQSAWTNDGHDIIRDFKRGLTKPKVITESPTRTSNGKLSRGARERLQAFADHLGEVFNTARPVDARVMGKLAPYCDRPHVESVPAPREIHVAVRRLRDSAGGIDGIQACTLKCLARDDHIFFDFIVEMVVEFWETQRLPAGWEGMLCTMLFKMGDATKPGNYRSIMLTKVTQKPILIIIGNRLEVLIESLGVESQCGFRGGRGTRDAIFTLRPLLRKRKEHQQEPWAVFIDLVKAFDTANREFLWAVLLRFGSPEAFVERLRVIHKDFVVALRKDGEEVRLRSPSGRHSWSPPLSHFCCYGLHRRVMLISVWQGSKCTRGNGWMIRRCPQKRRRCFFRSRTSATKTAIPPPDFSDF